MSDEQNMWGVFAVSDENPVDKHIADIVKDLGDGKVGSGGRKTIREAVDKADRDGKAFGAAKTPERGPFWLVNR